MVQCNREIASRYWQFSDPAPSAWTFLTKAAIVVRSEMIFGIFLHLTMTPQLPCCARIRQPRTGLFRIEIILGPIS